MRENGGIDSARIRLWQIEIAMQTTSFDSSQKMQKQRLVSEERTRRKAASTGDFSAILMNHDLISNGLLVGILRLQYGNDFRNDPTHILNDPGLEFFGGNAFASIHASGDSSHEIQIVLCRFAMNIA